jgi:hypothetical protein
VVTASLRHAARIGEAIRLQLPNYPLLASFFTAGPESFRVVDLERAQGLVRDHVIFSPGYGRTPHGRALHNFGPLSAEGGRAKFALAMTRARRSLHVLSCFKPEDLDVGRLSHGALDLYELLDREIAGNTDLGTPASRAAASEQALGADPLVADLGDRLRARGARVWHQYDGVLDVAAAADPVNSIGHDEAEIPRPVAIESDGTEQYLRMSVRERSRLRPQLLERLGWRYMPLWTIEVFTDPSACADRIGGYLGLEKPVVTGLKSTSQGFFEDDVDNLTLNSAESDNAAPDNRQFQTGADESGSDNPGSVASTGKDSVPLEQASTGRYTAPSAEAETESSIEDSMDTNSSEAGSQTDNGEAAAGLNRTRQTVGAGVPSGVLPNKASEDDPKRWGDRASDYDHDAWLQEQKPPHWG